MVKSKQMIADRRSKLEKIVVGVIVLIAVYVIGVIGAIVFALSSGMNIDYTVSGEINREAPAKVENSYGAQLHADER